MEALKRMKVNGMSKALVYGASVNAPAQRLYASVGFSAGRKIPVFAKNLSG